jgi:hypothetical protein
MRGEAKSFGRSSIGIIWGVTVSIAREPPGISGGGSFAGFGVGSVSGRGGSYVGSPGGSCSGLVGGSRAGGSGGSCRGSRLGIGAFGFWATTTFGLVCKTKNNVLTHELDATDLCSEASCYTLSTSASAGSYSEPPRLRTAAPRCLLKNGHLSRCPARKNQNRRHPGGSRLFVLGEVASDVAALHQAVDIALSLTRLYLATSCVTSSGNLQLGELAPLRPDFLDDDLLGLGCNPGGRGGCARSRGAVRAPPPRP